MLVGGRTTSGAVASCEVGRAHVEVEVVAAASGHRDVEVLPRLAAGEDGVAAVSGAALSEMDSSRRNRVRHTRGRRRPVAGPCDV